MNDKLQARQPSGTKEFGNLSREELEAETQALEGLLRVSCRNVIEIGRRLQRVHAAIGRWLFQEWLLGRFELSPASASRFMSAARVFGDREWQGIQPSALILLSRRQVPEAAREKAIEIARSGTSVRLSDARSLVAYYVTPTRRQRTRSVTRFFNSVLTRAHALSPDEIESLAEDLLVLAESFRKARGEEAA